MSQNLMNTKSLIDSSGLDHQQKKQGTYWICEDTCELYYDITDSARIKVRDIIILQSEAERFQIVFHEAQKPITFYFVITTKILWFYDGDNWIEIIKDPIVPNQIEKVETALIHYKYGNKTVYRYLYTIDQPESGMKYELGLDYSKITNLIQFTATAITENEVFAMNLNEQSLRWNILDNTIIINSIKPLIKVNILIEYTK